MNQGNNVEPPTRSTLLSTYWRDPEYLAHVPLTSSTALDYFSRSSFFDPSSTNEMLRMQNIVQIMQFQNGIMGIGKTARQQEEELTRFKGIEFVLVYAKEPKQPANPGSGPSTAAAMTLPQGPSAIEETLFVIQKRRRASPIETHVLETYYIANGNVHMAPDVETILNNRMITALHSLRESLSLARSAQGRPITTSTSTKKRSDQGESSNGQTTGGTLGAEATAQSIKRARETGVEAEELEEVNMVEQQQRSESIAA